MTDLRVPLRARYLSAGSGRRVYASPEDFDTVLQDESPVSREMAAFDSGKRGGSGRGRIRDPAFLINRIIRKQAEEDRFNADAGYGRKEEEGANLRQNLLSDEERGGDDELRRAAAILLAHAPSLLTYDLCDACSSVLHNRLTAIASGTEVMMDGDLGRRAEEFIMNIRPLDVRGVVTPDQQKKVVRQQEISPEQPLHGLGESKRPVDHSATVFDSSVEELAMKMASHSLKSSGSHNSARTPEGAQKVGSNGTFRMPLSLPPGVSEDARVQQVKKKDFTLYERVNGVSINILKGLELHANVFNQSEQKELVDYIYQLQELGRNQMLRRRTYSEPRKWMRGKGRVTIQFGCCYNYAVDKDGNPPGIIREEEVDEIPDVLRGVIKRMVRWHVLPSDCAPDSCIVNIYDVGDCIPPHIDHHDFVRPFCTVSLLSECNIVFGSILKIAGPGEFKGSIAIPLPMGSVLVLNGNGADVAKHAVPAVPSKRISITFRKMDPSKVPHGFRVHPDLVGIEPLRESRGSEPSTDGPRQQDSSHKTMISKAPQFSLESDFPPLGGGGASNGRLRQ